MQSFQNNVLFPEAAVCNSTCPPMAPALQGSGDAAQGWLQPSPPAIPHSLPADGSGMCLWCHGVTDGRVGKGGLPTEQEQIPPLQREYKVVQFIIFKNAWGNPAC